MHYIKSIIIFNNNNNALYFIENIENRNAALSLGIKRTDCELYLNIHHYFQVERNVFVGTVFLLIVN